MNNNVKNEGVSSKYTIKKTTASELMNKWQTGKNNLSFLASQKITIPIKTKGGRILYLPFVKIVNYNGVLKDNNQRNRMPMPLSYLAEGASRYQPATVDDVVSDQKRIAGDNFAKYKDNLKPLIESLTFVSDVLL